MQNSHLSLGIFSSEGGQFIGGHGMKEENKIRTATALSSAWDGESIKRIRAAEQPIIITAKRLSMHLMVQPNIAANFLSDHDLKNQRLLSRLLVISPTSAIGTRVDNKSDGVGQTPQKQALTAFKQQIMNALSSQPKEKADNASGFKTRAMILNDEAIGLYLRYSNQIERLMAQNEKYENIRGFANKLPEHATRIAATLALMEDITTTELTSDYMQKAIAIADFYAREALRLIDEDTTDPKLVLAEKLLNWLHNSWKEPNISLPDIYQSSLNAIDTKAKAVEVVRVLEEHGWLRRNEGIVEVKGRQRQESWGIYKNKPYATIS